MSIDDRNNLVPTEADLACDAMKESADSLRERANSAAERDRLHAAIVKHHSRKADDRCWIDDLDLYEAAGLPYVDCLVGDQAAMLKNCIRFIACRTHGGGWQTYAELEAERDRLRQACAVFEKNSAGVAELWEAVKHIADRDIRDYHNWRAAFLGCVERAKLALNMTEKEPVDILLERANSAEAERNLLRAEVERLRTMMDSLAAQRIGGSDV